MIVPSTHLSLFIAAASALVRNTIDEDGAHKVFVGLGSGQVMVGPHTYRYTCTSNCIRTVPHVFNV